MSRTTGLIGAAGAAYLNETASFDEADVHLRLRAHTAKLSNANMQFSPEQARLMGLLARKC